jgi:hypothetical protein
VATVPSSITWTAGTIPTAAQFNSNIRDPINFFKIPPRVAVAWNATPVTRTATATWELMRWNVDINDTDGIHDPVTNNSRLVAATAGMYHVWCNIVWEEHSLQAYDGARGIMIRKNSAGAVGTGTLIGIDHRKCNTNPLERYGASQQGADGYAALAVNDYVEAFAYDTDDDTVFGTPVGCYLDPSSYGAHRFGMTWVSI